MVGSDPLLEEVKWKEPLKSAISHFANGRKMDRCPHRLNVAGVDRLNFQVIQLANNFSANLIILISTQIHLKQMLERGD